MGSIDKGWAMFLRFFLIYFAVESSLGKLSDEKPLANRSSAFPPLCRVPNVYHTVDSPGEATRLPVWSVSNGRFDLFVNDLPLDSAGFMQQRWDFRPGCVALYLSVVLDAYPVDAAKDSISVAVQLQKEACGEESHSWDFHYVIKNHVKGNDIRITAVIEDDRVQVMLNDFLVGSLWMENSKTSSPSSWAIIKESEISQSHRGNKSVISIYPSIVEYIPFEKGENCLKCPGECVYQWRNTLACHDSKHFDIVEGPPWNPNYLNVWAGSVLEFSAAIGMEISIQRRKCFQSTCMNQPYYGGMYMGSADVNSGRLNVTGRSATGQGVVTSIGFISQSLERNALSEISLQFQSNVNRGVFLNINGRTNENKQDSRVIMLKIETEHAQSLNMYTIDWVDGKIKVYRNGKLLHATSLMDSGKLRPFVSTWVSKSLVTSSDLLHFHSSSAIFSEISFTPLKESNFRPPSEDAQCHTSSFGLSYFFITLIIISVILCCYVLRWCFKTASTNAQPYEEFRPRRRRRRNREDIEMTEQMLVSVSGREEEIDLSDFHQIEIRIERGPGQEISEDWMNTFLGQMRVILEHSDQGRRERRSREGVSAEFISRLPLRRYNSLQDHALNECSICLGDYENNEQIRTLPCFHVFHASCVDPWLRRKGNCPICKMRLASQPT